MKTSNHSFLKSEGSHMNFDLLYKTFPQLTPFNASTDNKYIFESEQGLLEVPKNQLTEQERIYLSIFLKPLSDNFQLQHLWWRYFQGEIPEPPVHVEHYQLLKIIFAKSFHDLNELQLVLEAIVQKNCYILQLDANSVIVLLLNEENFIDFTPFLSIIEDDFKASISILTTPYETGKNLKERFDILQSIPNDFFYLNSSYVYKLDEIFFVKMLTSISSNESQQFIDSILQTALHEPVLLETVACYFRNIYNFSQTAKELYIHRNTLQKRLNRFEQLSERDLKNSDDLLKIAIAIKMYKMHTTLNK